MGVNADKPHLWKGDIARSVAGYNEWYLSIAVQAYRDARTETADRVEAALLATANLTRITPEALRQDPRMLAALRMATAPPVARDRLIGLAGVSSALVYAMEQDGQIPLRLPEVEADLERLAGCIARLADRDIFPWLDHGYHLTQGQIRRAATIVGDRLCMSVADAIIRAARGERQRAAVTGWLERHGYTPAQTGRRVGLDGMAPGTFACDIAVPVIAAGGAAGATIPVDLIVMPVRALPGELPLLIDVRSTGDWARAQRRRAEDVGRVAQLGGSYGHGLRFVLFLCGYFDSGYLGAVAAEGIDWVWEHRIDDLAQLDLAAPGAAAPSRDEAVRRDGPAPLAPLVASGANRW